MSDNQEPSLQELEAQLRADAAQADMGGAELQDDATAIGETSGATADPVKTENGGADTEPNTSDDGGNGDDAPDTNETGENADQDNPDDGGNSDADSSSQQTPQKTKAQREEERRDKSWKKLQQERAEFLREKAEFEASKLTQQQAQQNNPAVNPEALAKSYDDLATEFENAGDFDNADEARRRAEMLRNGAVGRTSQQPQMSQAQNANGANNAQFMAAWSANVERAKNEFPEMQDENSDFGKNVTALLRAPDTASYFSSRPDGAYVAAKLTQMKMAALRVPALEKENAALKEEIKKLRQGMSLPDSGASGRAGTAQSFDSMSLAQQEAFLRKQAESDDASARPAVY